MKRVIRWRKMLCLLLTALLGCGGFGAAAADPGSYVQIVRPTVNHQENPIGLDDTTPYFGWAMESNLVGQCQTQYRIVVENMDTGEIVWDNTAVSAVSQNIPYTGAGLTPQTRYQWQVTVWDVGGKRHKSEMAYFETGLMPEPREETETAVTAFTIELDFAVISEAFGLIFGAEDTTTFYMWQINAGKNALRPHRWNHGAISALSETGLTALYPTEEALLGQTAHLKIAVDNGRITTSINETLIHVDQVEPFDLGKLGFRQIHDSNTNENARVDNIRVTDGDGTLLLQEDFSATYSPYFTEGILQDGWFLPSSGVTLQTAVVEEDPVPGFDNAKWIGAPDLQLTASATPVWELDYTMSLTEGNRAGVLVGAADPRLLDKTKNVYRVEGENYIWIALDAAGETPMLRVYRKGYCTQDYQQADATSLLASGSLEAAGITQATLSAPHTYQVLSTGGALQVAVDGVTVLPRVVINPTGATQDVICYTYLCNTGFAADPGAFAVFQDYRVRTYDSPKETLFGETTGATWEIFRGLEGITLRSGQIRINGGGYGVAVYADPSTGSVPMFRRQITAKQAVTKARLYVTSRGIYEFYINGSRVSDQWFNPGYTQYNKTIPYNTYDVTDAVQAGENLLAFQLASGWWSDEMTFSLGNYNFWGHRQALLAKLELTYVDGTTDTVVTDESWQVYEEGPITYAGYFNGEHYDATREAATEGWKTVEFDSNSWSNAAIITPKADVANPNIVAMTDAPVRVVQTLDAVYSSEPDPNVYVYDMGTNMTGVPEITFPQLEAGQVITIRYAEMYYPTLPATNPNYYGELSGKLLTENLRAAQCTDTYIAKGTPGGETYRPTFTFHGYQYIELSGLDAPLPAENIKGLVLSSVSEITASYDSSNALANQLSENIIRSLYGNHISIPTDCTQRDERMGWTGDAQVFSRTATYFTDMDQIYTSWESTIADNQSEAGWIPDTNPNLGYNVDAAVSWPAASVIPVWETYCQYGDTAIIRNQFDTMKNFLDAIHNWRMPGKNYLTNGTDLAEHLALISTNYPLCNNITYYRMLTDFSQMAAAIGEEAVAATYAARAEGVKQEWNATFLNAEGRTQDANGNLQDTQASYALALQYDILLPEHIAQATQYLDEACARGYNGTAYTMTSGFIGTPALLPALTKSGLNNTAYQMFEQTAYPSWLFPVTQGATSIWERWNGFTLENGFGGNNWMNSFNHYAYGAVGAWMINCQVGITNDPEVPGFSAFLLQPAPGGSYTYLNGSYISRYGKIVSNWTATDGVLKTYDAAVPANTSATLYLPVEQDITNSTETAGVTFQGMETHNGLLCARYTLLAGGYHFAVDGDTVTIALADGFTTVDTTPDTPDTVPGDMNEDGNLSVTDVVLLRKAILNSENSQSTLNKGDMNSDNQLSVTDVVLLRKEILRGG